MKTLEEAIANADALGKVNYELYCTDRGWVSFNGDKLPPWEQAKEEIRNAWRAGAIAVVIEFLK